MCHLSHLSSLTLTYILKISSMSHPKLSNYPSLDIINSTFYHFHSKHFLLSLTMMMMTMTTTFKHIVAVPSKQKSQLVSIAKAHLSNQHDVRRNGYGLTNAKSNLRWMAAVGENVTPVTPASVPVRVAHELHQAGHRYLDVRTPEEFAAGHAVGAINVPYFFSLGSGMTKNPDFVEQVMSHFTKDDEILVGCQLGKRSLMAATHLLSEGFTGVTDIAGGYAAWNQNGLPIES